MRAPRLLAAGTAAATLLLTGCSGLDKPSPIVSVVSGGTTIHDEAVLYCFEGQDPTAREGEQDACSTEEGAPEVLEVRSGDQIGIDVAKDLADGAWVAVLSPLGGAGDPQQQQQGGRSEVQEGHYFAFNVNVSDGPLQLEVHKLESRKEDARAVGVWRFVLAPR